MILYLVPLNNATHDAAGIVACTQLAGGHAGDQYEPTAEDWDVVSDGRCRVRDELRGRGVGARDASFSLTEQISSSSRLPAPRGPVLYLTWCSHS